MLRDVTAQARLERARRDLIANASHEFKTPLFSLAGSLELIDEGDLSPEEQREFLQIMRQQVDRLRNLAVSMLDLSRVEAGSFELHPEDVDLATVGQSVLDEFQAQAQSKDVALSFEERRGPDGVVRRAAPGAGAARADRQRHQVLARRQLRASVGRGRRAPTRSWWSATTAPASPSSELPHVFERFHRGSEERGTTTGAGLGLSIARELTEMMGGAITAESPPDGGARFTVRLPRTAARPQAPHGRLTRDARSQALMPAPRLLNSPVGDR